VFNVVVAPRPRPTTDAIDRRQRAAIVATFVSHGMLFASWTAHIPGIKEHLGLSDGSLGTILLCAPVGSIVAMIVTGRLLPRVGSRLMVRVCVVGTCAVGPLVGLAGSPPALGAALLLWGAFQGSLDVSMNTAAVAVQQAQDRHLMPVFHGTWSIGAFAGAGIGTAAVALHIGLASQLIVVAVPVLIAGAVLTPSLIADEHVADIEKSGERAARPRAVFSRAVLALGAIAFAAMLCEGSAADWSAVYLRTSVHVSPGAAGLGYAAFALMMTTVRLSGSKLLARVDARRLVPACAGAAAIGMAVALITGTAAATLVGFGCLGVGMALVVPLAFTAAGQLPNLPSGAGIAAVSALGWAGFVCGPPLIGELAQLTGLRSALAVVPALCALIAVSMRRSRTTH
jgi:predicted MFS family arabinose efflux permease